VERTTGIKPALCNQSRLEITKQTHLTSGHRDEREIMPTCLETSVVENGFKFRFTPLTFASFKRL
jgi:hypothetical protein